MATKQISLKDKPLVFKKGDVLRAELCIGLQSKTKIHVVRVMRDVGVDLVVYRYRTKYKNNWTFEVKTAYSLRFIIRYWKDFEAQERKREKKGPEE